jgi:serine/threonine protein kinase
MDATPMDPEPSGASADLPPGSPIGEYQITSKIADGGMGTVYAGIQPNIGKKVAIKVAHPALATDPRMVERFLTEARVVNRIGHPHIVDIFAFGQLPDGRQYFVMELLEGVTLQTRMERESPLPLALVYRVIDSSCDALEAAHAHGVVHRDLKPDNVFLGDRPGGEVFVKLLDFGIVKLGGEERASLVKTGTGIPIGTPYYMSPEQCRGVPVDSRTDVYALGVLLYEMITGRVPFLGDSLYEVMQAHLQQEPQPPQEIAPGVHPKLAEAALRALAKAPADRFQSAAEMRAFVARIQEQSARPPEPPKAPTQPAAPPSPELRRRYEGLGRLDMFERLGLHYSSHGSEVAVARQRAEAELVDLGRLDPALALRSRRLVEEAADTLSRPETRQRYRLELLGADRLRMVAEHLTRQAEVNMERGDLDKARKMVEVSLEMHATPEAASLLARIGRGP